MKNVKWILVIGLLFFSFNAFAATDTDGDGYLDAVDSAPQTVNGNIINFAVLHETRSYGEEAQILFDLKLPATSGLSGLTAVISGPNSFSYTVQDSEVSNGEFNYASSNLAAGTYVLTVTDTLGNSVHRSDSYIGQQTMPMVTGDQVSYALQANGDYAFRWPIADATETYYYRLRIVRNSDGSTVYSSPRSHRNLVYVSSSTLSDPSPNAYRYRVEVNDNEVIEQMFNRSVPNYTDFTANAGNVTGLLPRPGIYNLFEGSTQYVVASFQAPDASWSSISAAELVYPDGVTSYQFVQDDYNTHDHHVSHKFAVSEPNAPANPGLYTLNVTSNGIDYAAKVRLTTAVQYPAPDHRSWQVKNLGNNLLRFSWADINYNGALYYRVLLSARDGDEKSAVLSTPRAHTNFVDVDLSTILPLEAFGEVFWRVEVHDSTKWQTVRNRSNGINATLVVPVYDPAEPDLFGRINHKNYPNGEQKIAINTDFSSLYSDVLSLDVNGVDSNYSLALDDEGDDRVGPTSHGYTLSESGPLVAGLYQFDLTDTSGSVSFFDTLTSAKVLPIVDSRSVHIDQLASGELLLSWAPVHDQSPLWYNIAIRTHVDHNQDGFPDEVFSAYSKKVPFVIIPANSLPNETLEIILMARDASTGRLENNRSISLKFAYEGPGFDYSTLIDADNDGWASNIDLDDTNGLLTPLSDIDADRVLEIYDAFPTDPAASIDTDGDGYPDSWNEGKTQADSTTGLTLDAFPDNPAEWQVPAVPAAQSTVLSLTALILAGVVCCQRKIKIE